MADEEGEEEVLGEQTKYVQLISKIPLFKKQKQQNWNSELRKDSLCYILF